MAGLVLADYPYDLLEPLRAAAAALPGGAVDLSIGTPCDPPPRLMVEALASSGSERGYPASQGGAAFLDAARAYLGRRFGVALERRQLGACVGSKELVAGLPHWLRLRDPSRDTVLYPAISYPTYEMGAVLAGCRAVPVPAGPDGGLELSAIGAEDAARALCLWVNSPANPTGALSDLAAAASFGRAHDVLVCSDECYAEFTFAGRPRSILEHGSDGVLALHSLSKRSNAAGIRAAFYAGDGELVDYLVTLRKHAGFMVPGPVQAAAAAALADDGHVDVQRARYLARLERLQAALGSAGVPAALPSGGFYLWVAVPGAFSGGAAVGAVGAALPEGADWGFTAWLAERAGAIASPGRFYGDGGRGHVRLAVVRPDEAIELVARRLEELDATDPELRAS